MIDVIARWWGQESISLVQTQGNARRRWIMELVAMVHNAVYMPMLQTAEVVAKRYNISRDRTDGRIFARQSQQRTAAAQAAGKFDDEDCSRHHYDECRQQGDRSEVSQKEGHPIAKDEGNRADTTLEGLKSLNTVLPERYDHRRQCQRSCPMVRPPAILMEAKVARIEERPQPAGPLCRYGGCWH